MFRRRRAAGPVTRHGRGLRLRIEPEARAVLIGLLDELEGLLRAEQPAEALQRLFPPAYHEAAHAEAEAEYQRLMRDELVESRLASLGAVRTVLAEGRDELGEADALALVGSLNQLRLVLGTLLEVSEDDDDEPYPAGHPLFGEQQLYFYLSWLLTWAVDELAGD